jgi:hypothetical protein
MWTLVAALVFAGAVYAGWVLVAAVRRRPAALALPLAFAVAVCLEALLVYALSAFGAIGRPGLLAGNAVVVTCAAIASRRMRLPRLSRAASHLVSSPAPAALVTLLALLVFASALEYLPNNWDSMTYRLARVAYWLQQGSVDAFATGNPRQNALPPGSEYLVLVLQAIAGSDALANMVQLTAWALLAIATGPLARAFGAPQWAAPWASLFVAAAPMAVLQASSTQSDLVAALLAVALVVAALPFIHSAGSARWRWPDVALAAAVASAALLVKPTAVVAASPFVLWAAAAASRAAFRQPGRWREIAMGAAVGAVAMALVLGPFLFVRAQQPDAEGVTMPYVYQGIGELPDRLLNVGRGLARHVPLPREVADLVAPPKTAGCAVEYGLCTESLFRTHEDFAGNPGQALLAIAALVLAAIRWRRLPARAQGALRGVVGSWIVFHVLFRDNVWISRLQLPEFALGALVFAALAGVRFQRGLRWLPRTVLAGLMVVAAHGVLTAASNEVRPPVMDPRRIAAARLPGAYYASAGPALARQHAAVLDALTALRCQRLGLLLGGDSYEYPLVWRAMQQGAAVQHVRGPDPWPCALFTDLDRLPTWADRWTPTPIPGLLFAAP